MSSQTICEQLANIPLHSTEILSCAIAGAGTAFLLGSSGMLGGAIFGASLYCGHAVAKIVVERLPLDQSNETAKTIKLATTILGPVALAAFAASLLGFTITFITGLVLTAGVLLTASMVRQVVESCFMPVRQS